MTERSKALLSEMFVKGQFLRYYREVFRKEMLAPIQALESREWAFVPFGYSTMKRHIGFGEFEDVSNYVSSEDTVPKHMYLSSAQYEAPHSHTMEGKTWLGADLVFDLDADHIPGAEDMSYVEMLDKVKGEFIDLVEEFLLGDLGFKESELVLKFSGSRGYHAHVQSEDVLKLDANMRRDIAAYIEARDLPFNMKLHTTIQVIDNKPKKVIDLYRPGERGVMGWRLRSTRYLIRYFKELGAMPKAEAISTLSQIPQVGKKRAEAFLSKLQDTGEWGRDVNRFLEMFTTYFSGKKTMENIMDHVLERYRVCLDVPVTGDIHRLIRCPNSLHGKSGLAAVVIPHGKLDNFDPLVDSVPALFRHGTVVVEGAKTASFELLDQTFEVYEGRKREMVEGAANFAICRGLAYAVVS